MSTNRRRSDRKRALEILYAREISEKSVDEIIEGRKATGLKEEPSEFCTRICAGVAGRSRFLDEIIERYAEDWRVERMPVVDRNILRMGLHELLFEADVPVAVTINEAVEMAKIYGTEDSRRFVNGVLGRIARELDVIREEVG